MNPMVTGIPLTRKQRRAQILMGTNQKDTEVNMEGLVLAKSRATSAHNHINGL